MHLWQLLFQQDVMILEKFADVIMLYDNNMSKGNNCR